MELNSFNNSTSDIKSKSYAKLTGPIHYYRLSTLEGLGLCSLAFLPFSIRVLLESALRNAGANGVLEAHIGQLASWKPIDKRQEIQFKPARVILQDFTGVPALVDLAAMRDLVYALGGDASLINPIVQCDLVIDHSLQVDYAGCSNAQSLNEQLEFKRNAERYRFLKWGQKAFKNFRVVPPATGIVHQVNLEYLTNVVFLDKTNMLAYPDSCIGTDSHTPMVNGVGVLSFGVGGIEAEAVMLNQPISMSVPDVIGICLDGELEQGVTSTDVVLFITELCRKTGVVGKFVEFFGQGVNSLSIADRSTIANMSPEQGATISFFPVDDKTLDYLRLTGKSKETIDIVERYTKEQGLFRYIDSTIPNYSAILNIDLSRIEPSVAGPKRPQDRIALKNLKSNATKFFFNDSKRDLCSCKKIMVDGKPCEISNGSVVLASISSCTNTSNPSVMICAGLLAKKACELGLKVKPYVRTSFAPGSRVVSDYLQAAGLLSYLEELGFNVVGYGCATCIGNSGPLFDAVTKAVKEDDLVVAAVISGNRNFEGRVHPLVRANYLASPALVVAFALMGLMDVDFFTEPVGVSGDGQDVFLKDIWPSNDEICKVMQEVVTADVFKNSYEDVFLGSCAWRELLVEPSLLFNWDDNSNYIRKPSFLELSSFNSVNVGDGHIEPIQGAYALGVFGDSVTTDHISPAGPIASNSPAALYLRACGVSDVDFNSYGSRRGNHEVMMRGTFANIRLKNKLVAGLEGNFTKYVPSGEVLSFFNAAQKYSASAVPLIIIAGKEYGSGSSRDWAAKGPALLGVRAVIAQSFERIHRSNLIGMGVMPLEFKDGENLETLSLTGEERFNIELKNTLSLNDDVSVFVLDNAGEIIKKFFVKCRIDTNQELQYYKDGGILNFVVKGCLGL